MDGGHADDRFAWLRDIGESDYVASGRLDLNYGRAMLAASDRLNKFFDPTPTVIRKSDREVSDFYARQAFGRDFSVAVKGSKEQQDQFYEAPKDSLRQRTYSWTGEAGGKVAGGYASLNFSDWRYFDRTNVSSDNKVKLWGVTYARQLASNFNVEGNYFRSTLKPKGGVSNNVQTVGLTADWDITTARWACSSTGASA